MHNSRYHSSPALSPIGKIKNRTENASMTNLLTPKKCNQSVLSSTRITPMRSTPSRYALSKPVEDVAPTQGNMKSPQTNRFNSNSTFFTPSRVNSSPLSIKCNILPEHTPRDNTPTHQAKYGRLGMFPVVHFFQKKVPVITPKQNSCVIKLSSNGPSLFGDSLENSYDIPNSLPTSQTETSTRSVLDALKEISRKRIRNECFDKIEEKDGKRHHESVPGVEYSNAKRNRDDDVSPNSAGSESPTTQQAPKRICVVDPIYASNTSSICLKNNKRKLYECWLPSNDQKPAKKLMSVETQTLDQPTPLTTSIEVQSSEIPISPKVTNASSSTNSTAMTDPSTEKPIEHISDSSSEKPNKVATPSQRMLDEKIYAIHKKNKLARVLSRFTGEEPKLIPLPRLWDKTNQTNDVTDSKQSEASSTSVNTEPSVATLNGLIGNSSGPSLTSSGSLFDFGSTSSSNDVLTKSPIACTDTTTSIATPISSTTSAPKAIDFVSNDVTSSPKSCIVLGTTTGSQGAAPNFNFGSSTSVIGTEPATAVSVTAPPTSLASENVGISSQSQIKMSPAILTTIPSTIPKFSFGSPPLTTPNTETMATVTSAPVVGGFKFDLGNKSLVSPPTTTPSTGAFASSSSITMGTPSSSAMSLSFNKPVSDENSEPVASTFGGQTKSPFSLIAATAAATIAMPTITIHTSAFPRSFSSFANTSTTPSFGTTTNAATNIFGSTPAVATTTTTASNFGTPPTTTSAPIFGTITTNAPTFGLSTSSFGSTTSPTAPPAYGTTNTGFGTIVKPSTTASRTFGTIVTSTTPSTGAGGFSFKTAADATAPTTSLFGGSTAFGASNAPGTTGVTGTSNIFGATNTVKTTASLFGNTTPVITRVPGIFAGDHTFGTTAPSANQQATFNSGNNNTFGVPKTTTAGPPAFGSGNGCVGTTVAPPAYGSTTFAGGNTFGTSITSAPASGFGSASGNFGNTNGNNAFGSTTQPQTQSNVFGAGASGNVPITTASNAFGSSTGSANTGFGFGATSSPAFGSVTTPAPAFGTNANATTTTVAANASNTFGSGSMFGQSPNVTASTGFGGSTTTPAFGANSTTPAFGATTGSAAAPPAFGTAAPGGAPPSYSAATATTKPFSFGGSAVPGTSGFGSSTGTASGFSFNTTPTATTTASSTFGSGGNNAVFSFGSNAPAPPVTTTSPAFAFGATTTSATPAFGGQTFGASSNSNFGSTTATPSAAFGAPPNANPFGKPSNPPSAFGAASSSATPAFGGGFGQPPAAAATTNNFNSTFNSNNAVAANSTFSFGSTNNNNNTGFGTGSSGFGGGNNTFSTPTTNSFNFKAQPVAADASKPVFAFGASEPAKPASGAFNFSAAVAPTPNFGGGGFAAPTQQPGMFSIGSGTSTASKRVQLRAKRRT